MRIPAAKLMSGYFPKTNVTPQKTEERKKGKNFKKCKNFAFLALFAFFASTVGSAFSRTV